jgi:hypothetical protein
MCIVDLKSGPTLTVHFIFSLAIHLQHLLESDSLRKLYIITTTFQSNRHCIDLVSYSFTAFISIYECHIFHSKIGNKLKPYSGGEGTSICLAEDNALLRDYTGMKGIMKNT